MSGILIAPARCTANLSDEFKKWHVCQVKFDGSRYVLYLGYDPYERRSKNALLSRRVSTVDGMHVDRTLNVPHITDINYSGLEGTVLDGECFLIDGATTTSIMGSGPEVSQQKQKENGLIIYHVFDVPVFRGKDIRGMPLDQRQRVIEAVTRRMNNEQVVNVDTWDTENIKDRFLYVVANGIGGGEGLVVKDLRQGYGSGWAKYKKSSEVSCFISGFKPGKGKYESMVGAIEVSVLTPDGPLAVGYASGFDDKLRKEMSDNPEFFIDHVVDLYAHELSKKGLRLRHPTFYRLREDLCKTECTLEKLKADIKNKIKSQRWRTK